MQFLSKKARHFGRISVLHRHDGIVSQAECEVCICLFVSCFTLLPWRRRRYINPKHRTVSKLHSISTQKTVIFILTPVRTWNPVFHFLSSVIEYQFSELKMLWASLSSEVCCNFYGHEISNTKIHRFVTLIIIWRSKIFVTFVVNNRFNYLNNAYEEESVNSSQMDIKRKTCDIRTWTEHPFLEISSTNIDIRTYLYHRFTSASKPLV
jgi:hypothetical protein